MAKKFYLKERHNPQFKKPYYVPEGQLSKAEARRRENSVYGYNVMLEYETEKEYNEAIAKLKADGYNVH
jgi:hypothetical protein